ncbi:MAG: hypothetical protein WCB11_10355 [Terriglobales bacterium]
MALNPDHKPDILQIFSHSLRLGPIVRVGTVGTDHQGLGESVSRIPGLLLWSNIMLN